MAFEPRSSGSPAPFNPTRTSTWRTAELVAWLVGASCLLAGGALLVTRHASARVEIARFEEAKAARRAPTLPSSSEPNFALWSPKRVEAWRASMKRDAPVPLAILRIPNIGLEVPVLDGTDDWTLDRAVGHIEDTAKPGTRGNVGLAGHRDGFFRGLKDLVAGDALDLETADAIEHYRVERIWIVNPDEVSVLDPTPSNAVTLVTCYPFYFIGSAPQRYIVRAVPAAAR